MSLVEFPLLCFAAGCGRKILINEGFEINEIYMIMNAYARLNPLYSGKPWR